MKRISLSLLTVIFGFCFMGVVNAAEASLDSVASLTNIIGGSEKEIVQIGSGTYKYYYKIMDIGDNEFNGYVASKYIVDNTDDSSDQHVNAQSSVSQYEQSFTGLIDTVTSTADLGSWTESKNNEIVLKDLQYEAGVHHGYVLGVAAVKAEDSNIYISRNILESKSATTLGLIEYNDADKALYESSTTSDSGAITSEEDTATDQNPETGIEDYAIYLTPIAIMLGSTILFRRNYA